MDSASGGQPVGSPKKGCCGINTTHLKALVKKDLTNLTRRWCYCLVFICFPPLLGLLAWFFFKSELDNSFISGSLLESKFQHHSFNILPPTMSVLKDVGNNTVGQFGFSPNMMGVNVDNNCKRLMVASEDEDVREAAKDYAENFMLSANPFLSIKPKNPSLAEDHENKTKVYAFESLKKMEEFAVVDERENCVGIYFKKVDTKNFDYEVMYSFQKFRTADTNLPLFQPLITKPDLDSYQQHIKSVWLHPYITDFLAKYQTGHDFKDTSEWNQRPLYNQDIGYTPMSTIDFVDQDAQTFRQLADQFPNFVQFSHLFIFIYIIQGMVGEKETKARQGMKIMGLQDGTYYLGWFIHFLMLNTWNTVWQTIWIGQIFDKVSPGTLFVFFNLFSTCLFGIALVIQSLTSNSKGANGFAIVFFFLSYQLNTPFQNNAPPEGILYVISVFPTIVLIRMIKLLFIYQYKTDGLEFGKDGQSFDTYSVQGGLLMLLFMTIFYVILGLYLDQVVPMEFGVAKPWNFCCKKKEKYRANKVEALADNDIPANKKPQNFEAISENLKRQLTDKTCMKVRGLKKEFSGKYAVKGVDLTMYQGQIFALLGHNGAGKTTTLSMLTGMLEQNEGEAEVFGFNIFDDMDRLRSMLGVCPQHDILFHYLTPQDHLRMFSSFKGTPEDKIEEQVQKMLADLDLLDQKDQQSHTLSGGQKRKLSVAISMIGDSKVIMLDEPTSGMDTTSRRRLWEMLKKNKGDKIVILTTHYMDEADILGDRIAIMTEGEVECTGSSLFLKQRYGVGYQLIIEKAVQEDLPQVEEYLRGEIPDIMKLQEVSGEISFQIPKENSSKFKEFFEKFDANLERLQLRSYSVGITTLEEVFLKIGHGEEEQQNVSPEKGYQTNDDANNSLLPKTQQEQIENYSIAQSSNKSCCDQFIQLSAKKLRINMRTPQTFYQELIIPFVIILLFVAIGQADFLTEAPGLNLDPSSYDKSVLYYNDDYTKITQPICADPKNLATCQQPPNYGPSNSEFVENNMYCNDCGSENIWTKNEEVKIKSEYLKQDAEEQLQIDDFEKQTYAKQDKETCNIFINEISYPKKIITPNDPKTFKLASLLPKMPTKDGKAAKPSPPAFTMPNYLGTNQYDSKYKMGAATYSFVLLVQGISPHSLGIWSAYIHEIILRDFLALEAKKALANKVSLKLINDPFPLGRNVESGLSAIQGFLLGFGLGIVYVIVSPSLVRNVVEEREKGQKNQMIVSGVKLPAYWFGHYVKDVVFGLILGLWVIILIAIFDINVEYGWLFIILGAFVNPPFLYIFSYLYDKADNAGGSTSFYMFLFAFLGPIAIFVLQIIESTREYATTFKWILSFLSPQFAIISAIISISFKQFFGFLSPADGPCGKACDYSEPEVFDERIAKIPITCLLIQLVLWWLFIAFIDSSFWKVCMKVKTSGPSFEQVGVDEDIINEDKSIQANTDANQPIRIYGAKKEFTQWDKCKKETIPAVKRISFGLQYGECFALLGISGAGKTTMFKMITGEIQPSEGQMSIIGNNVLTPGGLANARKYIGYCPQFDCLYPTLTVKEHLELYASLKGIDKDLRDKIIHKLMTDMGILEYIDIQSQNLSGGNKRKLSVSMAIMGNPPIIFLDEPSTGVDPQAKRFMWNIVSKISREKKQSSVILTTHSMEEAEALCNKMGIMVKGEFKCFGSASHIKDKYGTGYEIEFKIRTLNQMEVKSIEQEARNAGLLPFTIQTMASFLVQRGLNDLALELNPNGIGFEFNEMQRKGIPIQAEEFIQWQFAEYNGERFVDMISNAFEGVEIVEHWSNTWKLKIKRGAFSIGYLFGMVEQTKGEYQISEYSVAQTSLEQIFNNFAASAELKEQFKRRNSVRRSNSGSFVAKGQSADGGDVKEGGDIEMIQHSVKNTVREQKNTVVPIKLQKTQLF